MGLALPLGIESEAELCDVDMYGSVECGEDLVKAISSHLPEGITAVSVSKTDRTFPQLPSIEAVEYEVHVPEDEYFRKVSENLLRGIDFVKQGKKGEKEISFSTAISSFKIRQSEKAFDITARAGQEGSLRIDAMMVQLAERDYSHVHHFRMVKKRQFFMNSGGELEEF